MTNSNQSIEPGEQDLSPNETDRANWFHLSMIGGLVAVLLWLVVTTTLPYALSDRAPGVALALNHKNPTALIARAEQLREERLNAIIAGQKRESAQAARREPGDKAVRAGASETGASESATEPEQTEQRQRALRDEIEDIAQRAIRNDPLNARAFRLLGEVTPERNEVRRVMQAAVARSRHESLALFWLLSDSFALKDYVAVMDHADRLLLTKPALARFVVSYIGQMLETQQGRDIVTARLETNPSWRAIFFRELSRLPGRAKGTFALMVALKRTAYPPSYEEQRPHLKAMLAKKQVQLAYNMWLQLLPADELGRVAMLNNADFNLPPKGMPFEWRIGRQVNAVAEFTQHPLAAKGDSLHIRIGSGRVDFPEVSQIVVLQPGRYRISGEVAGTVQGKRGLIWQLRCLFGRKAPLGATDMLRGKFKPWQSFEFVVTVPDDKDCSGQTLRVFHDARSASEKLVTGDVWFDNLKIEHVFD